MSFIANPPNRHGTLNNYDVIKFLALVIMTIDHIGAFLYPDLLWFRAIGRLSAPVWFFLVGFSSNHTIRRDIIIVGLLMIPLNPLTGVSVFPLNALISIIASRLALNAIDNRKLLHNEPLILWLVLVIFGLTTSIFIEYGSFALMIACLGYISRHKLKGWQYKLFYLLTFLIFVSFQLAFFAFDWLQSVFVILGVASLYYYFYHFEITEFARAPAAWITAPIRTLSHQSLYYYALHRAVLQLAAAIIFAKTFEIHWFDI